MTHHTSDRHLSSHFSRSRLALSVCSLLLACLLAACSLGGTAPGTVSNNTSAAPQATSAPAVHLTTYTGNGFTIGYPAGWTIEKVSPSAASVIFVDETIPFRGLAAMFLNN